MSWLSGFLWYLGAAALFLAGAGLILERRWQRRLRTLKQEMMRVSEDLLQVVELQADIYRRVCRDLSGIEEKVLDLSIPTADAPLPLERRHQVLMLARKNVAVDEIARRLSMPKGEVDLILRLRKYVDTKTPEGPERGMVRGYAQA